MLGAHPAPIPDLPVLCSQAAPPVPTRWGAAAQELVHAPLGLRAHTLPLEGPLPGPQAMAQGPLECRSLPIVGQLPSQQRVMAVRGVK